MRIGKMEQPMQNSVCPIMSAATVVNNIINMTFLSRRLKSSFCPGPHDHGTCSDGGQAHFPHVTLVFCHLCVCSEVPQTMSNDRKNVQCSSSQSQLQWGEIVQVHCGNSNSKNQNKTENHLIASPEIPKAFFTSACGKQSTTAGQVKTNSLQKMKI